MEDNLNVVDATQVGAVDQPTNEQDITTNEPVNAGSEEVTPSQVEEKPVQSAEENSKWASYRRQMEQEYNAKAQQAIDAEYSRLYGQEYGIHTKADYDKAIAEQEREAQIQAEAQQQGVSEEYARRLRDLEDVANTTKAEKAEYQRQLALINEDKALQTDETFSDYYKEHTEEIKGMATEYGVDLTTAMLLSIKDNFKAIKEGTAKQAQQETINNIIKNGQSSPGSVASGTVQQTNSIYNMSSSDFKRMQNEVLNGTRKNI